MTRQLISPRPWWRAVALMLVLGGGTALPAMGGEAGGLYSIPRDGAAESLVWESGALVRYQDASWLLADVPPGVAEDLRGAGVELELVCAGPPGRGFYLLSVGLDGMWGAAPASRLGVLEAGGLWLVPQEVGVEEELARAGFSYSLLPPGPLPPVGAVPAALAPGPVTAGELATFLGDLSESTLAAYNQRLEDFVTRYTHSDSVYAAAAWIAGRFQEFGYSQVSFDTFYVPSYPEDRLAYNVVAVKPGEEHPERQVVVGGHYDSVVTPGRPRESAPGADDNGSGTAAVMELARVLAPIPLDYTVVFIAFAAEEQGLHGSWHYAAQAYSRGDDIRLMINMDMIGYLEDEEWDVLILTNGASESYADLMADMALTYTPLIPVIASAAGNSDHWPFMQYGYHALTGHEGDFNDCWHRQCDRTDRLTFPYHLEVVRMVAATMISVADPGVMAAVAAEEATDLPSQPLRLEVSPLPGTGPFALRFESAPRGPYELGIFDVRGRSVLTRMLTPAEYGLGELRWDGQGADGRRVPAGVYLVRLRGPAVTATGRLVVIR